MLISITYEIEVLYRFVSEFMRERNDRQIEEDVVYQYTLESLMFAGPILMLPYYVLLYFAGWRDALRVVKYISRVIFSFDST